MLKGYIILGIDTYLLGATRIYWVQTPTRWMRRRYIGYRHLPAGCDADILGIYTYQLGATRIYWVYTPTSWVRQGYIGYRHLPTGCEDNILGFCFFILFLLFVFCGFFYCDSEKIMPRYILCSVNISALIIVNMPQNT